MSKSVMDMVNEAIKRRQEGLKTNPRYDIDVTFADKNGEVRVYFHSMEEYRAYQNGEATKGSTERFFDGDIFCNVPKERIEKITDGGTIVHIPAANS